MSNRAELLLGVIAFATLASALLQVAALVAIGLVVRRLLRLPSRVQVIMAPLQAHVRQIARECARGVSATQRLGVHAVDETQRLAFQTANLAGTVEQLIALVTGVGAAGRALRLYNSRRGTNDTPTL